MEPPSSSNDDQTQYQAQYWNGPEAGHWLVHEHRDEPMLAPFTRLVLGAAAVARTDRSSTSAAAAVLDAAGLVDVATEPVAEPLWLGRDVADTVEFLTASGIGQTPVRLESWAWLVTARNPW